MPHHPSRDERVFGVHHPTAENPTLAEGERQCQTQVEIGHRPVAANPLQAFNHPTGQDVVQVTDRLPTFALHLLRLRVHVPLFHHVSLGIRDALRVFPRQCGSGLPRNWGGINSWPDRGWGSVRQDPEDADGKKQWYIEARVPSAIPGGQRIPRPCRTFLVRLVGAS